MYLHENAEYSIALKLATRRGCILVVIIASDINSYPATVITTQPHVLFLAEIIGGGLSSESTS